jgi:hypothetical protein
MNATATAVWDTDSAMESQMAEWFPNGLAETETRAVSGTAETEDLLDAACAALAKWEWVE